MSTSARAALTPAEERIVRLVASGRSNPEVAAEIGIGRPTVEWHLWRAYRKLGVRSRAELAERLAPPPLGPRSRIPLGGERAKDEHSGPLPQAPSAGIYGFQPRGGRER